MHHLNQVFALFDVPPPRTFDWVVLGVVLTGVAIACAIENRWPDLFRH